MKFPFRSRGPTRSVGPSGASPGLRLLQRATPEFSSWIRMGSRQAGSVDHYVTKDMKDIALEDLQVANKDIKTY